MKKFLFSVLMAALAIPMTQAIDKTAAPFLLRGQGQAHGTMIQTMDLSKLSTKAPMLKGPNQILWDFEDESQMEDWMALDNDGDGFNWVYQNNAGLESGLITVHSGTAAIYSASYDNDSHTALTPENWLISPVVPLGGGLTLWACGQDAAYAAEVIGVYVCVGTPTSINDFVQVGTDVTMTGEMTQYSFDLSPFAGQEGSIAIVHYNCSDQFMLIVDDICIDPDLVVLPDPTTPTNLTANPTDVTADVAWTDTDDAAWNLRYRVYTPNAAKTYHWSAEEGEDMSQWMTYNYDGDDYSWGAINLGSSAPDGSRVFYSQSYANSGELDPDEYLITPEVEMGGELTFWAGTYYYPENFAVYIVTDVNEDPANWVEVMGKTEAVDGYYQGTGEYYTVDLSQYEGTARIAFRHFDSYGQYYLFLDDITYTQPGDEEAEWIYVNDLADVNYTIEGLTPETTYEVQVQAYNANQAESDWTESTIFTTLASQTAAPSVTYREGVDGDHTIYVMVTENEPNCELEYRYQYEGGEWSEWAPYTNEIPFTLDGKYVVEGRAKAGDKEWSEADSTNFEITPRTAVNELNGEKAVAGIRYYNAAGQEMQEANGMTIVVTTYTDGSTVATKVIK